MKAVINLFKQFYALPKELPNSAVVSQILVLFVFFFTLGFTVSQVIIFLVAK